MKNRTIILFIVSFVYIAMWLGFGVMGGTVFNIWNILWCVVNIYIAYFIYVRYPR